jgi:CDP-paratose 2-epimerase
MKLLVTGGAGFVGSNLSKAALDRGDSLTVFDDLSRQGSALNLDWLRSQGRFSFVHGDIRLVGDVDRAVEQACPDAVFHLAGQVAMTTSVQNPRRDFEVNALGTFNLLDALRRSAPEAVVVYSSTNKVYRDLETVTPHEERPTRYVTPQYPDGFPETLPFDPETPYGVSKGAADTLMRDAFRMFGQQTVVFRHSSMYGGRQFASFDQGWVAWFCQQALRQAAGDPEPFTVAGNGKQVRDLLHARDLVALYFSAVERIDAAAGEAFNIGGGMASSLSLVELFAFLEKTLGVTLNYREIPPRARDQKVFVADNSKAKKRLGWLPAVGYAEGLPEMLDWLRESGGTVQ